jgi:hypothetical protein
LFPPFLLLAFHSKSPSCSRPRHQQGAWF